MRKFFTLILLLPGLAFANESGIALKADSLRAEPFADAKTVGTVAKNDKVDILAKQGAWLRVKTAKSTGWVRLLSVRRGTASNTNQTAGLLSVASGRAGTGQVVATTGVRGLSEQDLKAAKFNEAEISKLESYTTSPNQGQAFASQGGLKAAKFSYLPATSVGGR